MIRFKLTDQDIEDISEALDDPAIAERLKFKLLAVRLHSEGAAKGVHNSVENR